MRSVSTLFLRGAQPADLCPSTIVLLIEIAENENLEESKVDTSCFVGCLSSHVRVTRLTFNQADTGNHINVITTAITANAQQGEVFVSRMFSPAVPGGEDPVCGVAHSVLSPYWYELQGIERGTAIVARQVSPRGGLLNLCLNAEKPTVMLKGEAVVFSTGVCYF